MKQLTDLLHEVRFKLPADPDPNESVRVWKIGKIIHPPVLLRRLLLLGSECRRLLPI